MRKQVTIGETEYFIQRMDPFTALRVFGDLQRDILPAVGQLLQAAVGDDSKPGPAPADLSDASIAQAITALSARLDGASLEAWAGRLLDPECIAVSLNGRDTKLTKDTRALVFRDAGEILELMAHVIHHNFADFLARWVGLSGSAQKLLGKLSDGSAPTSNRS